MNAAPQASPRPTRSATIPTAGQTEAEVLHERALAWQNRPLLRAVYTRYFAQMCAQLARTLPAHSTPPSAGRILELGGGSGNFKEYFHAHPELAGTLLATDLVPTPHIDLAVDAMQLPFEPATIDNIIMQDVLHHLPYPLSFFKEAQRVLRPGGRIIMTEPYISPLSRIGFKLVHPEPVDLRAPIFPPTTSASTHQIDPPAFHGTGAFASNQAIPTLLFSRDRARFSARFPSLHLIKSTRMSCLVYPLSGGFSGPCLIPRPLWSLAWALESCLTPLSSLLAFRMLVVLEKQE